MENFFPSCRERTAKRCGAFPWRFFRARRRAGVCAIVRNARNFSAISPTTMSARGEQVPAQARGSKPPLLRSMVTRGRLTPFFWFSRRVSLTVPATFFCRLDALCWSLWPTHVQSVPGRDEGFFSSYLMAELLRSGSLLHVQN
jgi:hypothetical protein